MSKLRSRKLWVAIGGMVSVVLVNLGVPKEIADAITGGIEVLGGTYLGGQSVVDAVAAWRASK